MPQPIIAARHVSKTYAALDSDAGEGAGQPVLDDLTIGLWRGDFTVIMGASGAGKSTLLHLLSGMDRPSAGDIMFDNAAINHLSESGLANFRRYNCGFIFQQIYLLDNMSMMDNVMAAGLLVTRSRHDVAKRAARLFASVKLPVALHEKFPNQVSGGEAQRVALVRALINRPTVLFADEPTGALDQASGTAVLNVLSHLHRRGQSIVQVTHDLKSARRGSRIVFLRDGQIAGDLRLGVYQGEQDPDRESRLRRFLLDMGW
ncbi:MAG: ABC transporter ATP-binding protein [Propionibacteriaceae bacterium]|jgi:putative ABC transport system ATP-binding protein|nr:ABC transporter ATP-binding protein [Propionibacteriaceae bacterium]